MAADLGLISIADLAVELDLGESTVRRKVEEGWIPAPLRIGRSIRWRRDVIDKWLRAGCPQVVPLFRARRAP